MINKEKIKGIIDSGLEGTDVVLVELKVSPSNQIKILLDSIDGVKISKCVEISRLVENSLDREEEDFELEVSSFGLDQPFMLPLHYSKNIERDVEVFYVDGRNIKGMLKTVELNEDGSEVLFIELLNKKKVKLEGKKKKVEIEEITKIEGSEIQKTKLVPNF